MALSYSIPFMNVSDRWRGESERESVCVREMYIIVSETSLSLMVFAQIKQIQPLE